MVRRGGGMLLGFGCLMDEVFRRSCLYVFVPAALGLAPRLLWSLSKRDLAADPYGLHMRMALSC